MKIGIGENGPQKRLVEAMSRFAGGEDGAFEVVYELTATPLRRYLGRLSGDGALAEDLTHETLLRIHRFRTLYRPGAAVMPWAFTIGRRLHADERRRRRAARRHHDDGDAARAELVDPHPLADQLLERKRLSDTLNVAIAKLPPSQADVCRLVKDEDFTPSETAARLGTSAGTARVRAHRAFRALRETLAHDFVESLLHRTPRVTSDEQRDGP